LLHIIVQVFDVIGEVFEVNLWDSMLTLFPGLPDNAPEVPDPVK
jgi:hypothetical protein